MSKMMIYEPIDAEYEVTCNTVTDFIKDYATLEEYKEIYNALADYKPDVGELYDIDEVLEFFGTGCREQIETLIETLWKNVENSPYEREIFISSLKKLGFDVSEE